MTAADDFTRADALFRRALTFKSRDGAPLTIMPHKRHGTLTGIITVLIAGVVAVIVVLWGRL